MNTNILVLIFLSLLHVILKGVWFIFQLSFLFDMNV